MQGHAVVQVDAGPLGVRVYLDWTDPRLFEVHAYPERTDGRLFEVHACAERTDACLLGVSVRPNWTDARLFEVHACPERTDAHLSDRARLARESTATDRLEPSDLLIFLSIILRGLRR
jgi:hypothetical protein